MSSIFQQAQETMGKELTRTRWAIGISGLLSIALGVMIIVWPNISLYSLVIVFGAFTLARGLVGLYGAITSPVSDGRGWLVFNSLISIAVGVVVFWRTDMSALALLYVIGVYAIALGVMEMVGAFWLPLKGGDRVLLLLAGAVSVIFGIVMFAEPGTGALAVLALIAAYALIVGVTEVIVAVGGEKIFKRATTPRSTAKAQPSH
jgi:uncharacterized membrane protein HdeD (DUF308 family)